MRSCVSSFPKRGCLFAIFRSLSCLDPHAVFDLGALFFVLGRFFISFLFWRSPHSAFLRLDYQKETHTDNSKERSHTIALTHRKKRHHIVGLTSLSVSGSHPPALLSACDSLALSPFFCQSFSKILRSVDRTDMRFNASHTPPPPGPLSSPPFSVKVHHACTMSWKSAEE